MKFHIHIPKLLEFSLNVVCDDVTLRGKECLTSPIPYPLYLRCITTYGDKYGKDRYSLYRFYRDIRSNVVVDCQIGCLYPNVLDHVVLDDDDVDAELITQVALSPLFDDAAASIQRFASRCLAADKSEILVNVLSQAIMMRDIFGANIPFPKPVNDVLLFYGAKLDMDDELCFDTACVHVMIDDVELAIEQGHDVTNRDVMGAIESGNCEMLKLVQSAYRESIDIDGITITLDNSTVEIMELCMELNIIQYGTHYKFSSIPSFSVLQWILDHDVMEHDDVLIDIANNASCNSGHYFDMLRYLIEQRNFTVPRDVLTSIEPFHMIHLEVLDYLALHGADVNAVGHDNGENVLEHSPMLIRYWMDKGLDSVQTDESNALIFGMQCGMTAPVLEMMIDKYSMDINATREGATVLYMACHEDNYEVVEMLVARGADVNKCNNYGRAPNQATDDVRIKQLLIGCK